MSPVNIKIINLTYLHNSELIQLVALLLSTKETQDVIQVVCIKYTD